MSDRKYRQRGYQDEPRDRKGAQSGQGQKPPQEPKAPGRQLQDAAGPKTPNLMGSREVFRCARCGTRLALPEEGFASDARCKCGVDVHSCINCVSFDTSARWECADQKLTARVSPKDEKESLRLFPAAHDDRASDGNGRAAQRAASLRRSLQINLQFTIDKLQRDR